MCTSGLTRKPSTINTYTQTRTLAHTFMACSMLLAELEAAMGEEAAGQVSLEVRGVARWHGWGGAYRGIQVQFGSVVKAVGHTIG